MIRKPQVLHADNCYILDVMEWCVANCRGIDHIVSVTQVGDGIVVLIHCDYDRWLTLAKAWDRRYNK